MSWPFSRLTTYLFQSLPAIKSADLNTIQDYIVSLFAGTKTIKSLWADAVGDQASGIPDGTIEAHNYFKADVHQNTKNTVAPFATSGPYTTGIGWQNAFPITHGFVHISGGGINFVRGYNVTSVTRTAAGIYVVTAQVAAAGSNAETTCLATALNTGVIACATPSNSGGFLRITINLNDDTGAPADSDFSFIAFG